MLIVDLDEESNSVYRPMTDIQEFRKDDVLTVEEILPGFKLHVTDVFM